MTTVPQIEIMTAPGVWVDITADVRIDPPITIGRGKQDEDSLAGPQRLSFTLKNHDLPSGFPDGRYSPRNPMSDLFGKLGRNTPVRCKIDDAAFTRFYGFTSSLDPKSDESDRIQWVPVEAYGVLRRLQQGKDPITTALRDWVLSHPSTLAAYYPLSGGDETVYSQNVAPGKTGSFTGSTGAIFKYGVDLPDWLGTGMELNATGALPYMQGIVGTAAQNVALDFVFRSDALGVLDVEIWPTQDSIWTLRLNTSADAGTLQVSYYDGTNPVTTFPATLAIPELQDTALHTCRFEILTQAGIMNYRVWIDGGDLRDFGSLGAPPALPGSPWFRFHYSRFTGQTVMTMAHLTVWADNTESNIPAVNDFHAAARAYAGETVRNRLIRLAADGDVPISAGAGADQPMGPQQAEPRFDAMRDCEATDRGILLEERTTDGLQYVTRKDLYVAAQGTPTLVLDYAAGQVYPPLEPVDDDQLTRNDVTATRRNGGSVRVTRDSGPLGTQEPPTGVGRYTDEVTVNPQTDGPLQGIATWIANLGTLDKARYPKVTVNLLAPSIDTGTEDAVKQVDVGHLIRLTGMQAVHVHDVVDLIVVGYNPETIGRVVHLIEFVCIPADPYQVAKYGTTHRFDADGSVLQSAVGATDATFNVIKTGTSLWTTTPAAFPFDINVGGERMTVTDIDNTTSPQLIHANRSVNGVIKSHVANTPVQLWATPRYAL